jgi:hypothetical protein
MNRFTLSLLAVAGMGLSSLSHAQSTMPSPTAPPISKESYAMLKADAEAKYKIDDTACGSLSGNTKDICVVEAKARLSVSKADAEASFENTPKNREAARLARADANYAISVEKCDDLAGNGKDVCVKEAKAALVSAKADAKVDRVTADTRIDAADKQSAARSDAKQEKTAAAYDVAVEKCDVLAGQAKDDCVGNAKMQFGK